MYQYQNFWRFHNPGNDTIYDLYGLDLIPVGIFRHGKDYVNINQIIDPESWVGTYRIDLVADRQNYWILEKVVITMQKMNEYRPGQWGGEFGAKDFNLFIDKSNGSVHNLRFTDDLLGIVPDSMTSERIQYDPLGQTYRIFQALDLVEWIDQALDEGTISSGRRKEVLRLRSRIDEDSNPVLFVFKERKEYRL